MDRHDVEPRKGWPAIIEQQGLIYWRTELPDGGEISYWDEAHHYSFTEEEVYEFEAAARLLMEMLIEAGDYIIEENLFSKMGIPGWAVPKIKETWDLEPPMVYGRFDFAFGPDAVPKLLEYNADTPTAALETGVIQWYWLQDVYGAGGDQWNSLHEELVRRWKELKDMKRLPGDYVHMLHTTAEKSGEAFMTIGYLAETARQAGLSVELMPIESLGYLKDEGFVDLEGDPVRTVFKLYPWEWIVHERDWEELDRHMGVGEGQTVWIEPIWKMMWSNKGILPVLWKLNEGHPNLLPAFFEDEADTPEAKKALGDSFVRKPLLAREGADSVVVKEGNVVEKGPEQGYGSEGFVVQKFADLGDYGGVHPVLGIWTVDMEPVGCGIRESDGYITNNTSRFVPHVIA